VTYESKVANMLVARERRHILCATALGEFCQSPPERFFSVIGGVVIKPRAYDFYSLAGYLYPLKNLKPGTPLSGDKATIELLTYAKIGLLLFTGDLDNAKYMPSAFKQAKFLFDYMETDVTPAGKGTYDKELNETKVNGIKESLHDFETLLDDDLQNAPIFCCEEEALGNLSVRKLLAGGHKGYSAIARQHIEARCTEEIDESGRCLVYERSTASGYHILRAIELMILAYLQAIPGFTMPPINRQNWGEYIQQLKNHNADKGTIDQMQNLKDNHRNPLMHPQDTLTMPEAVSLFAVGQSTIETIVADGVNRGTLK
jgi:hypothetical protein